MIVDSLAFVGESLFGWAGRVDDLIAQMDELRIDRAVVCPVKPRTYHLESANEVVAEAVRARPLRLVGFARIDPNLGEEACSALGAAVADLGLRGLFLHPREEVFRVNDRRVDALLEVADVPVLVAAGHPWVSEGPQVGELARRHPGRAIVATNGGQLNISGLGQADAEHALAANPNLLLQTTGVYREDFLEGVVARLGAERLLFASGFPLFDPRLEILRVRWAPNLDAVDRERILGGNADRLLAGA
jgi:uncharacterized protein